MEQSEQYLWPFKITCAECWHSWYGICESVSDNYECPRCHKARGVPFMGFPMAAEKLEANDEKEKA